MAGPSWAGATLLALSPNRKRVGLHVREDKENGPLLGTSKEKVLTILLVDLLPIPDRIQTLI